MIPIYPSTGHATRWMTACPSAVWNDSLQGDTWGAVLRHEPIRTRTSSSAYDGTRDEDSHIFITFADAPGWRRFVQPKCRIPLSGFTCTACMQVPTKGLTAPTACPTPYPRRQAPSTD
ncbi:hypothetical protein BDV59DRAFT_19413 [Aspergillus ambiguus]|uniref:uncharacterized protein n=1 Tax=Aspergillus ambiguus TaxID=176160 RepID=UPI003CCD62BD